MDKQRHSHNALPLALGELEFSVLQSLWENPGQEAKLLSQGLSATRPRSLSTVQTTLERLVKKGYLARQKQGHAYRYTPLIGRGELLGRMMKEVFQLLHDGRRDTILSSFVNVAAKLDAEALDELEQLIQAKRRESKHD